MDAPFVASPSPSTEAPALMPPEMGVMPVIPRQPLVHFHRSLPPQMPAAPRRRGR
jgi:hypothetical protein